MGEKQPLDDEVPPVTIPTSSVGANTQALKPPTIHAFA